MLWNKKVLASGILTEFIFKIVQPRHTSSLSSNKQARSFVEVYLEIQKSRSQKILDYNFTFVVFRFIVFFVYFFVLKAKIWLSVSWKITITSSAFSSSFTSFKKGPNFGLFLIKFTHTILRSVSEVLKLMHYFSVAALNIKVLENRGDE